MTIKLRPYDKTTPPPPQQWEGHLRLEQRSDGVVVRAVYPNGESVDDGTIVLIGRDGVFRHYPVNPSLGMPLDPKGRLRLNGEFDYSTLVAELEAEVTRLKGSEAPPDKGARRATEEDRKMNGYCLLWYPKMKAWISRNWCLVRPGSWVREQPPPPGGGS